MRAGDVIKCLNSGCGASIHFVEALILLHSSHMILPDMQLKHCKMLSTSQNRPPGFFSLILFSRAADGKGACRRTRISTEADRDRVSEVPYVPVRHLLFLMTETSAALSAQCKTPLVFHVFLSIHQSRTKLVCFRAPSKTH